MEYLYLFLACVLAVLIFWAGFRIYRAGFRIYLKRRYRKMEAEVEEARAILAQYKREETDEHEINS